MHEINLKLGKVYKISAKECEGQEALGILTNLNKETYVNVDNRLKVTFFKEIYGALFLGTCIVNTMPESIKYYKFLYNNNFLLLSINWKFTKHKMLVEEIHD